MYQTRASCWFTCTTKGTESRYLWDSNITYPLEYSDRLFSLLYIAVVWRAICRICQPMFVHQVSGVYFPKPCEFNLGPQNVNFWNSVWCSSVSCCSLWVIISNVLMKINRFVKGNGFESSLICQLYICFHIYMNCIMEEGVGSANTPSLFNCSRYMWSKCHAGRKMNVVFSGCRRYFADCISLVNNSSVVLKMSRLFSMGMCDSISKQWLWGKHCVGCGLWEAFTSEVRDPSADN